MLHMSPNKDAHASSSRATRRPSSRGVGVVLCRGMVSLLLILAQGGTAWIPAVGVSKHHRSPRPTTTSNRKTTSLYQQQPDPEKILRNEIAERNSDLANEERYAVPDGSFLEALNTVAPPDTSATGTGGNTETEATAAPTGDDATTTASMDADGVVMDAAARKLQAVMERFTQRPRAYPLFLLEKGTEIVETLVADIAESVAEFATSVGLNTEEESSYASTTNPHTKERLVVLGTGWGGASLLQEIDTELYDVTVISPRNHFVFTPMLAGASVGTVEYRSICQPVRELQPGATFLEATATSVTHNNNNNDSDNSFVTCESVLCEGNSCRIATFDVPYDRLICTVGAQTNTFGIPGVKERCNFLKTVEDARRIKSAIVNCFERANLPELTDEERIQDLTFCVIGAGPTGIEFAAELRDFVEQDVPKYYPKLLPFVRIKVIEASPTILAPFDKSLQNEAISQLNRRVGGAAADLLPYQFELTELLLESSVKEVGEDCIALNDGRLLPYGLAVWAAGNGPIPLTLQLIDAAGQEQAAEQEVSRGRLAIDAWMRVIGSDGRILSFGDCSCITTGQLPATAQVASQQGEYLAKLLNKKFCLSPERTPQGVFPPPLKTAETKPSVSDAIAAFANANSAYAKPFQFLNLGILAYTGGGSALAQVTPAPGAPAVKGSGKLGNAVWRSVYLSKQVSNRNRWLVLNDWANRRFFGRDITRL